MPYPKDDPRTDWFWNFLLHVENSFLKRIRLFFISEFALLASYFTIILKEDRPEWLVYLIILFGVTLSFSYFIVASGVYDTLGKLSDINRKLIPEYNELVSSKNRLPLNSYFAIWLPGLLSVFWAYIFILAILQIIFNTELL